jgi:hypothetical protein
MKDKDFYGQKISFKMCKTELYNQIEEIINELRDLKRLYEEYEPIELTSINENLENLTEEEFLNVIFDDTPQPPSQYDKEEFLDNIKRIEKSYKRLLKTYFTETTE